MTARFRLVLFCALFLLGLPLVLSACGGAGKQSINGQVTAVDATARTFTLAGNDGKNYVFKLGSGVDIVHVKEHMDGKKEIKVEYTGTTAPYEASSAD